MRNFLLELYSEEIPARMQQGAAHSLISIFKELCDAESIKYENLSSDYGPCRISINADIADQISAITKEVKGPKTNAPEAAILGFCKSNNVDIDDLTKKVIKDEECYFLNLQIPAKNTAEVLSSSLESCLKKLIFPKSMQWGEYPLVWVRPLRSVLCMIDNEIIKFKFGHLTSGNITYGHKFMNPDGINVEKSSDYKEVLKNKKVIVSAQKRQDIIISKLTEACSKLGITLNLDAKLLEEVTGLAEYPVVLYGRIDNKFMNLPKEVLATSMKNHQKYFTASDESRNLAPYFLFVTNLDLDDYSAIIEGNERVLRARLSDALYFYSQDKKVKLIDQIGKLKNVVFHAKAGTIYDRLERIVKISEYISPKSEEAKQSALLSKADLVTEMVAEFPELQGIMGSYYAKEEGYGEKICLAIKNHYKPLGISDNPPEGLAAITSLSDKIDSLATLFFAGERATGSKDPYALRRNAIGILKTIIFNKIHVNLTDLFAYNLKLLNNNDPKLLSEILSFIDERLKQILKDEFADFTSAQSNGGEIHKKFDPYDIYAKCSQLSLLLKSEDGEKLLLTLKRIKNILGKEITDSEIAPELFETDSEKALYTQLEQVIKKLDADDLNLSINKLASLCDAIDKFFNENLINSEIKEVTNNRKALISKILISSKDIISLD